MQFIKHNDIFMSEMFDQLSSLTSSLSKLNKEKKVVFRSTELYFK